MSPEQVSGRPVDARSDVYALGTLLYEMLTLSPPFRGGLMEVMTAHLEKTPVAPRALAPDRQIPLELERACLRALAKSPEDRPRSARALHDEVQAWLEAASDKAKRAERASELAAKGRSALEEYYALKNAIERAEAVVEGLRRRFHAWQSVDEKRELFAAEDEAARLRRRLAESASEIVMTLSAALGQDQQHAEARRLMAELYWDRFCEAESRHDAEGTNFYERLVASFHDGKYEKELQGDGSILIDSTPPGAQVTLYRLEERALVSLPVDGRSLGATPARLTPVPMASYLAILHKDGFRDTRCPIWISRNRAWETSVRLFAEGAAPDGFVLVPRGPFVAGGDPELQGWALPACEPDLDDFWIAVHPVTMGQYLDFLDALARENPDAARARSPRRSPDGGYYLSPGADGRFVPLERPDRSRWRPELPVVSISWHDAVAFCEWRSRQEGRRYRLPSELEWEKAARGVDGRWYPWGDRFDSSLCNMETSLEKAMAPQPVESFETDVSLYGVRGMAGNVRDWTATRLDENAAGARDTRIIRGGAFNLPAAITRSANRFWLAPNFVLNYVGFRLACSPE